MGIERARKAIRVTDDPSFFIFKKMAAEEGFGTGSKTNTMWDFVRVLMDFYTRNQAIDNIFDRIEFKIRDIKAITPHKIKEIIEAAIDEKLPVIVRASMREELERFDDGGE